MRSPKGVIALGLLALAFLGPMVWGQAPPPHPVISQVQVAPAEFVEIYNPSNLPVDLTGWYWCYFPTTRTAWDEPYRKREFPSGATVPPHGFYLVQVSGPLPVNADWSIGYESGQLSNTSGTVAIFSGSPSARTLVDAVGWGKDANLREGSPAPVPKAGQSIV